MLPVAQGRKFTWEAELLKSLFFLRVLVLQLQLIVLFIRSDSGICLSIPGRCLAFVLKRIRYPERFLALFSAFVQIVAVICNAAAR